MMVVLALLYVDVQSNASRLAETLQTMRNHLRRQTSDFGIFKAKGSTKVWP